MFRNIFCLFFILFLSCLSPASKNVNEEIVLESEENGKVKEILVINTRTREQTIIRYFESGKVMAVTEAKDSVKNGIGVGFFETGDTASILNFRDGKLNGLQKWFQDDYLTRMVIYNDNIPIGEEMLFGEKGTLAEYVFHLDDGSIRYHAFFDKNGSFVQDTGHAILEFRLFLNKGLLLNEDTVSIGDSIEIDAAVIKYGLDNIDLNLQVEIINSAGNKIDSIEIDKPENHLLISQKVVMNYKGRNTLWLILKRKNIKTGQTVLYKSNANLIVR